MRRFSIRDISSSRSRGFLSAAPSVLDACSFIEQISAKNRSSICSGVLSIGHPGDKSGNAMKTSGGRRIWGGSIGDRNPLFPIQYRLLPARRLPCCTQCIRDW
jgi:hypothetical protein